eukprot:GHVU01016308.1.p1 GENE.GHVU01016308.1~~GHVU01016308.1.p1  ORF type:complete len:451 (+),score=41.96 GHVU01016308.1:883-2235(+)
MCARSDTRTVEEIESGGGTTDTQSARRPKKQAVYDPEQGVQMLMLPAALEDDGRVKTVRCLLCLLDPLATVGKKRKPLGHLTEHSFKRHQRAFHPEWRNHDDEGLCVGFERFYAETRTSYGSGADLEALTRVMHTDFMLEAARGGSSHQHHSQPEGIPDGCKLYLPKQIVQGVLQAHGKDPATTRHHFQPAGDKYYTVTVASGHQLRAVQRLTGKGVSYVDQEEMGRISEELDAGNTCSKGIRRKKASWFALLTTVMCMCLLAELLGPVWTFAIALDSATLDIGVSLLAVDIRVPINGKVETYHLCAIPLLEKGAEYCAKYVKDILTLADQNWRRKLIGITSDGATVMLGADGGLSAIILSGVNPPYYAFWCGTHMADLCIGDAVLSCKLLGVDNPGRLTRLDFAVTTLEVSQARHRVCHVLAVMFTCTCACARVRECLRVRVHCICSLL